MFDAQIAATIRKVGLAEAVPRFRALTSKDISEKAPGDLVTVADRETERVLAERLQAVLDIPVVGEEATALDPTLLDLVASAPAVWVVDPIDGTSNFVDGNPNWVIMVSLIEAGATQASWIWHAQTDEMLSARRGKGVRRNGTTLAGRRDNTHPAPRGILKRRYMEEPARSRLADFPDHAGVLVPALKSAGVEYGALVTGGIDFLFYWRTLPWDHAPGALIAEESGMWARRIDGAVYEPGDGRFGLLAAPAHVWTPVADVIATALAD